ncbi:MAG TPA: plastocyanin/azurin family copper-binding protein [Edaphobacter sp.]|jgi:plastocyanin|nr:plastocyanin/azurin family copper-binding protein [Edaphobacter sp.]
MKFKNPTFVVVALSVVLANLALTRTIQAQQIWNATAGAQSKDMGKQAIAFLPNELWIHAGDSIKWTSASGDIHTVSFFIAGQPYADFTVGCPGFSPSGVSFNGLACVSAPPLLAGDSFTVKFTMAGNFKLICLVHPHMTGVIHVLAAKAALPHDQAFYDKQAADQQKSLLTDADPEAHQDHSEMDDSLSTHVIPGKNSVAAGIGEMAATGAGFQSLSIVRFLNGKIVIRAGDTVEWTNKDPALPHTVTFGVEPDPAHFGPPSGNVSFDADGAGHATIHFVGDSVHSGIFGAAPQDQSGVPVAPPAYTVFRITFTHPGTYDYKCALHDNLGMLGKVVVLP